MGGNALKTFNTIRLNSNQFESVKQSIKEILDNYPIKYEFIKSYSSKSSHGDLDVIFCITGNYNFIDNFISTYNPIGYKKNGDVLSFVYPTIQGNFQIDLIKVSSESFEFANNYFNYNDLSNLLGRVYSKAGFKLGHDGLKYTIRDHIKTNHIIEEITVTLNWQEAMDFMDYSSYFNHSFDTLEDIFKFTVSSKYSNKDIYLLENRNHISRMRDKKRPTYTAFLKWLNENEGSSFDWNSVTKTSFLIKALDKWPQFKNDYIRSLNRYWRICKVKEKFNGDIVSELTGLKDKELGMFIKSFKESYNDFNSFILRSSNEEITNAIIKMDAL